MNRKQRRAGAKTSPDTADGLYQAGTHHHRQGRLAEAEQLYRQALAAAPHHHPSLHRLGVIAHQSGRPDIAAGLLARAVARDGRVGEYHGHLGLALGALGRTDEAIAAFRKALALAPAADTWNNLGALLAQTGQLAAAAEAFRAAIALVPALPEAQDNLGDALWGLGDLRGAADAWQQVVALAPGAAGSWARLALARAALDEPAPALAAITRALVFADVPEVRRAFVQVMRTVKLEEEVPGVRALLLRALQEQWNRPDDLAPAVADIVKKNGDLKNDTLLAAMLTTTPNQDWELEQRLSAERRALLAGEDAPLEFAAAMARQCFLNEYVWACGEDEARAASALRAQIAAGDVTPLQVAIAGMYAPLPAQLLERQWPQAIEALLTQQVREPQTETAIAVPRLTAIDDATSRAVQAQYEENPYPRWASAGGAAPEEFAGWLRRKFPAAADVPRGAIDILIAGCGTGRNAIETAQMFSGSRVLAVDLSRASLAYAMRKRRSPPIEFAQADILALGSLERRFGLIEAVGVLHHMADPFAGWRVLLGLLSPGGVMKLGFYSAVARRNLPRLDATNGAEGIRTARAGLAQQYPALIDRPDFYTTSTCRDLLYHVQEIRLDLERIGEFLREHNLNLLGFALDDSVLARYRARFPADGVATNLQNWQVFEEEGPSTFAGMYEFFVQRAR